MFTILVALFFSYFIYPTRFEGLLSPKYYFQYPISQSFIQTTTQGTQKDPKKTQEIKSATINAPYTSRKSKQNQTQTDYQCTWCQHANKQMNAKAAWQCSHRSRRRRRAVTAIVRMVELQHGVDGLHDGHDEEEDGGGEGEERPGAPEVGVDEVGAPHVPRLPAVGVHLPVHGVELAVRLEHHVLGDAVEQLRYRLVAADCVLDDSPGAQQRHVLGGVDDVVHEEDVGRDVVAGADVQPLERHHVQEHVLGGVVHGHRRHAQHAVPEADVVEALRVALLEPDPGLVQLHRRPDDVRLRHVARSPVGRLVVAVEHVPAVHVERVETQAATGRRQPRRGQGQEPQHHPVDGVSILRTHAKGFYG
jgi:hypothetical protein